MQYEIQTTEIFDKWFGKLKDAKVKARLTLRIRQVSIGHFGDHKQIDQHLFELRFFFGSGYRIYYTIRNGQVVFLLTGGDKSSQNKDIIKAKSLSNQLED